MRKIVFRIHGATRHDSEELIKVTDRLSQMNAEYQRYITKYSGGDCAAVVRREDLVKKQ